MSTENNVLELVDEYLRHGGLFNPELMNHERVRDMVIRLRDEVVSLRALLLSERDRKGGQAI